MKSVSARIAGGRWSVSELRDDGAIEMGEGPDPRCCSRPGERAGPGGAGEVAVLGPPPGVGAVARMGAGDDPWLR